LNFLPIKDKLICLVNLVHLDPPNNGGTSRVAREVCLYLLHNARHNPRLLPVFAVNEFFFARFQAWLGHATNGVNCLLHPYSFREDTSQILQLTTPDLVISPLFGIEPFQILPASIPHITAMPDTQALEYPDYFSENDLRERRALYGRLKQASKVVTYSDYARGQLLKLVDLKPEQLAVIPLGADTVDNATVDAEAMAQVNSLKPFVFYPANTWPHKRHGLLFAAMNEIWRTNPQINLVLSGGRIQAGDIAQLAAQHNAPAGRVFDLGYVDNSTLRGLYENAEAMLFTSHYEGFGMPLVEAMQHGCPVVAAPLTCIPEIVGEAAWLVQDDSPAGWAQTFAQVQALSAAQRAQRKTLAKQQAAKFTWGKTTEGWANLLAEFGIAKIAPNAATIWGRSFRIVPDNALPEVADEAVAAPQNQTMRNARLLFSQWETLRNRDYGSRWASLPVIGYFARTLARLRHMGQLDAVRLDLLRELVAQQSHLANQIGQAPTGQNNPKQPD
jgi:glycosyltransferase involved in cell wall biosynthesis